MKERACLNKSVSAFFSVDFDSTFLDIVEETGTELAKLSSSREGGR